MAVFVVDASVTLAWCFEDESDSSAEALLNRLRQGDRIAVPAHWSAEVANGLLVAVRRKRLKKGQPDLLLSELARLPIEMQPALGVDQARAVLALCEKHNLTVYDGAYLELAARLGLAIGTLDGDLRRAAQAEGVALA
jgi:predicted nucleic acid-binding protein